MPSNCSSIALRSGRLDRLTTWSLRSHCRTPLSFSSIEDTHLEFVLMGQRGGSVGESICSQAWQSELNLRARIKKGESGFKHTVFGSPPTFCNMCITKTNVTGFCGSFPLHPTLVICHHPVAAGCFARVLMYALPWDVATSPAAKGHSQKFRMLWMVSLGLQLWPWLLRLPFAPRCGKHLLWYLYRMKWL